MERCLRLVTRNTTIHGWKDLYDADGCISKAFWVIVLLGSLSAMCFQVTLITLDYVNEVTAARVHPNAIEKLPPVTVVPFSGWTNLQKYRDLDSEVVGYFSDAEIVELDLYMNGFFMYGFFYPVQMSDRLEGFKHSFKKYEVAGDQILKKHNYSIESFATSHAPAPSEVISISRIQLPPMNLSFGLSSYVSHGGLFYTLQQTDDQKIEPIYADASTLGFQLNYPKNEEHPSFSILLGGIEDHATFGRTEHPLRKGGFHTLNMKVHKSGIVSKKKHPCGEDTYSDYQGCLMRHLLPGFSGCRPFLPRTPKYKEESFGTNTCNYIKDDIIWSRSFHRAESENKCPPPCMQTHYELSVQGFSEFYGDNTTQVFISLSRPGLNIYYEEYFLYSYKTLFSALGGTISLWIGASVISVIQVGYLVVIEQYNSRRIKTDIRAFAGHCKE